MANINRADLISIIRKMKRDLESNTNLQDDSEKFGYSYALHKIIWEISKVTDNPEIFCNQCDIYYAALLEGN